MCAALWDLDTLLIIPPNTGPTWCEYAVHSVTHSSEGMEPPNESEASASMLLNSVKVSGSGYAAAAGGSSSENEAYRDIPSMSNNKDTDTSSK